VAGDGAGSDVDRADPGSRGSRRFDDLAEAFNLAYADSDEALGAAPNRTAATRIDQVSAARDPRLSWQALDGGVAGSLLADFVLSKQRIAEDCL